MLRMFCLSQFQIWLEIQISGPPFFARGRLLRTNVPKSEKQFLPQQCRYKLASREGSEKGISKGCDPTQPMVHPPRNGVCRKTRRIRRMCQLGGMNVSDERKVLCLLWSLSGLREPSPMIVHLSVELCVLFRPLPPPCTVTFSEEAARLSKRSMLSLMRGYWPPGGATSRFAGLHQAGTRSQCQFCTE